MRIQKAIHGTAIVMMTALFVACASGVKVSALEVDDARLHERTSFAWVDRGSTGPQADPALATRVSSEVKQAAVGELSRKGYQELPAERADMLVSYQVVITSAGSSNRGEPVMGMSPQGTIGPGDPFRELRDRGTLTPDVRESEGSLLVFITDRATGRILWRGTAESLMTSPREGARVVPAAVRRMFEKFPARTAVGS
jgi:hypothetical protein